MSLFLTLIFFTMTPEKPQKQMDLFEFAISSEISPQYLDSLERVISKLLLESMQPKDILILTDPHSSRRVMQLQLSEKLKGKSNALRQRLIVKLHGAELRNLRVFFQSLRHPPSVREKSPHFFRYVQNASNLQHEFPQHAITIVWLAPVIVKDENQIFSFENRYPNDWHLQSEESVFSTVGKDHLLSGFNVHLIHSIGMDEFSPYARDLHKEKLSRFYGLYLQRTGGQLLTFTSGVEHLANIKKATYRTITATMDESDKKLRSFEFQPPQIESQTIRRGGDANAAQSEMLLWQEEPTRGVPIDLDDPQAETQGLLSLGITWTQPCDLDIFVKLKNDKELSYKRPSSPVYCGRHLKDMRTSPEKNGYETVIYTQKVDLRDITSIWINHFSGRVSEDIQGVLRLRLNEDLYLFPFTLTSRSGNGGWGIRRTSQKWLHINVRDVVGTNEN